MRYFNTAGPIDPEIHYHIDPLARLDLANLELLLAQRKYFVLHAPRQTGKTSFLLALRNHINRQGIYRCVYANMEVGQSAREDTTSAMQAMLSELAGRAQDLGEETPRQLLPGLLESTGPGLALNRLLTEWSRQSQRPLVLLLDEIDSLVGDTLIAVLRQLRAGYDKRPRGFPQSVVLCGVRDVRDYRLLADDGKSAITGGSAFNIKAESLRMGSFDVRETHALLQQHTETTGQRFEPAALSLVWELSQGQPWLVNALAYECCFKPHAALDRSRPITAAMIGQARENLILRRETHLDQLADKLREARVRRVIQPILAGDTAPEQMPLDDIWYARDLGLITVDGPLDIANPIYREIIPRELTAVATLTISEQAAWYVHADGTLDLPKLLAAFQQFFREHSQSWLERFDYKEAGPQLLLQAFLQRIVNGGGRIEREYGLGRKRVDLLVIWPYPGGVQRAVLELKLLRKSLELTLAEGLPQTFDYLDRCGGEEAHLLIFDRSARDWEEKIFQRDEPWQGRTIGVWGM